MDLAELLSLPGVEEECVLRSPVGFMALHGGSQDRGTLEIARRALPGTFPFYVSVVSPTSAYVVRSRFPEDRTPGGRSLVIIDSYTGRVLFAEGSRTAPGGRRVEILNRAVHTGDLFGLPSKIVMSLASLMAPVQLVTGLMLWARRKRRWPPV